MKRAVIDICCEIREPTRLKLSAVARGRANTQTRGGKAEKKPPRPLLTGR